MITRSQAKKMSESEKTLGTSADEGSKNSSNAHDNEPLTSDGNNGDHDQNLALAEFVNNGTQTSDVNSCETRGQNQNVALMEFVNVVKSQVPVPVSEPNIIPFDPSSGMKFTRWVQHFNSQCCQYYKDDEWKVSHISKYLKGEALTVYLNYCLEETDFQKVINILQEYLSQIEILTFSKFTNLKFTSESELSKYFHTKLQIGREIGLNEKLLLEGLTEGLPDHLRPFVIVNRPSTPMEWLHLVANLISSQGKSETTPTRAKQFHNPQFRQPMFPQPTTRPAFISPRYPPTVRQWTPRNPNPYPSQQRYQQPPRFPPRSNVNQAPSQSSHYQVKMPSRPCRICEKQGIVNSYHWEQNCIFQNSNQTNPDLRLPESETTNPTETQTNNNY